MTVLKAIKILTSASLNKYTEWDYRIAKEKAVTALRKQIPREIEDIELIKDNKRLGYCWNCEHELLLDEEPYCYYNYCPNCGQAIDWSNVSDG